MLVEAYAPPEISDFAESIARELSSEFIVEKIAEGRAWLCDAARMIDLTLYSAALHWGQKLLEGFRGVVWHFYNQYAEVCEYERSGALKRGDVVSAVAVKCSRGDYKVAVVYDPTARARIIVVAVKL